MSDVKEGGLLYEANAGCELPPPFGAERNVSPWFCGACHKAIPGQRCSGPFCECGVIVIHDDGTPNPAVSLRPATCGFCGSEFTGPFCECLRLRP